MRFSEPKSRGEIAMRQHQRELLRRRHRMSGARRSAGLGVPAGVARARLDRHGQGHVQDGLGQVAGHVHGQRLEGRNVERVQATSGGRRLRSSTSVGRKPASVLPAPVGATQQRRMPACASASSRSW